jgi:C4-dicarboxylate-specific signal transduction histidine kinase
MMNRIRINVISLFFIASLLIFMFTGGVVITFSKSIINENVKIANVSKLYEVLEEVRITLRTVIISQRNYLITGENKYNIDYVNQKAHLLKEMEKLKQIKPDGYINEKDIILLDEMIKNKLQILDEIIDLEYQNRVKEVEQLIEEKSNPIFEKIQANASGIENSLEEIISEFRISTQKNARITKISIYSGYSIAFLLLFISFISLQSQIKRRKVTENELKNNTRILSELNAEKDKFFSILAHDLKNPFTALLGLMDLLNDSIEKQNIDQIKEIISMVDASARKTYSLLENLLEWARIQSGRLKPDILSIDAYELIEETYELLTDSAKNKNIQLVLPEKNKIQVYADKNMVQTVFRNIISNAIKFTPEGGQIKVDIKKEKARIIVSVSDTGCGIKQEELPLLFRLDTDTRLIGTGNNKGTGLGLILSCELMKQNKGDIWAESEFGKGSTFFIAIPRLDTV